MMNLTAWDFGLGGGGGPNADALQAQRLIEGALVLDPSHPLAAHLFIHLTEITPGRGQGGAGMQGRTSWGYRQGQMEGWEGSAS